MNNYFSENLKLIRQSFGYTPKQLASKIGKSRSVVVYYEQGKSKPSFDGLLEICSLFGLDASILIHAQLNVDLTDRAFKKANMMSMKTGKEPSKHYQLCLLGLLKQSNYNVEGIVLKGDNNSLNAVAIGNSNASNINQDEEKFTAELNRLRKLLQEKDIEIAGLSAKVEVYEKIIASRDK